MTSSAVSGVMATKIGLALDSPHQIKSLSYASSCGVSRQCKQQQQHQIDHYKSHPTQQQEPSSLKIICEDVGWENREAEFERVKLQEGVGCLQIEKERWRCSLSKCKWCSLIQVVCSLRISAQLAPSRTSPFSPLNPSFLSQMTENQIKSQSVPSQNLSKLKPSPSTLHSSIPFAPLLWSLADRDRVGIGCRGARRRRPSKMAGRGLGARSAASMQAAKTEVSKSKLKSKLGFRVRS